MWPNPALTAALRRDLEASAADRNFGRENARKLKEMAVERRRKEAEARIEEERSRRRPLRATRQFENVRPKVREYMRRTKADGEGGDGSSAKRFLRGHQKTGPFLGKDRSAEQYSNRRSAPSPLRKAQSVDSLSTASEAVEAAATTSSVPPLELEPAAAEDDLLLSRPETRFSELDAATRRSRIHEILDDICAVRPLSEGRSNRARSPSLGRRSRSFRGSLDRASVRSRRGASSCVSGAASTSTTATTMVSRSVQTDGEPAIRGQSPLTIVSGAAARGKEEGERRRGRRSLAASAKNDQVAAFGERSGSQPTGSDAKEEEEEGGEEKVLDRIRAVEDEVRDLRLDLEGIEGAIDADDDGDGAKAAPLLPVVKGVGVDYVSANRDGASAAGRMSRRKGRRTGEEERGSGGSGRRQPHAAGTVPRYLRQRKERWRQEEERRLHARPDPDCPPGHVRLSEDERLRTLDRLRQEYEAALREQVSIPVGSDTLRVRRRRREVEGLLSELDEALRTYSRPVVYVTERDKKEEEEKAGTDSKSKDEQNLQNA